MIKAKLAAEWERKKKDLIDNTSVSGKPATIVSSARPILSGPRLDKYLGAVKKLNESRLRGSKFAVARHFGNELKNLDKDIRSDQVISCYDCISSIVIEDEIENVFTERNWASLYRAPSNSQNRLNWNKALVAGSRRYLESSFDKLIDSTVAFYPRDVLLGGKPSNIDRIRAFLNIRMKRASPAELQKLDFVDGVPVWACIFYLFRCGFLREAYQFARQYEFHLLKAEPSFIAYLKAFIETEDNYLTGTVKAQIQSDYSQRLIVGNQDPYKMAILKIIGRCDLNKKNVPDVIATTQDYIWLQLWLVKDAQSNPEVQVSGSTQSYNLASLQKMVLDLGASYFNPKGVNPLQYFEILLLVGLFEDAIGFLFDSPHQLDAVHFAICLLYHGVIQLAPVSTTDQLETVSTFKDPLGSASRCLNIVKVISSISKAFSATEIIDSVQYFLLLPLAASVSSQYNVCCQNAIRDAILVSGNFSLVLGDLAADGTFRPGLLSKFAPLMNLGDEKSFVESVTKSAAIKCERDDKYRDAVHLYNLAGDYDKVLQILSRKMSTQFSQAYVADLISGLFGVGLSVYQFYSQSQIICSKLDYRNLETCRILLGLLEFKRFASESHWQQALQVIAEVK
jgi:nuclear pore complex protein Nup93